MPIWTPEEYANWITKKLDSNHNTRANPVMEHALGNEPLAKSEGEKGVDGRVLVRVTSVRKRLLDEDNIAVKAIVDCCRYSGLLESDAPERTKIEISQRKCQKGEIEHTVIEISK